MKLQYLGTAAAEGWPALFCNCSACIKAKELGGKEIRRRSGALVNDKILIDFSADLYFAKIDLKLDLSVVRHVLITHAHSAPLYPDNAWCYLPGIANNIPDHGVMTFYGSAYSKKVFEKCGDLEGSEAGKCLSFREVKPFETFMVEGIRVTALPADHGCKESLMYLLADGEEEWLYAHDTGFFREETWQFLKGHRLSYVSLDCTNGPLNMDYYGHMGFRENLQVRARMLEEGIADGKTVFICNHFSHNGHMLHYEMEQRMNPEGFEISYDGMVVQGK